MSEQKPEKQVILNPSISALNFSVRPIGRISSCYPVKFGTPRQPGLAPSSSGFIEIYSEFQPELSLEGLSEFSYVWVIFYFHKENIDRFHAKVHPPRLEGKTVGVFATRSPHRPNPVGLSLLKIEQVAANGVYVSGIDLIEGTPVLDIKPYLTHVEAKPEALSGWVDKLEGAGRNPDASATQPVVNWSANSETFLQKYSDVTDDPLRSLNQLRALINETVCLDPRPLVYKEYSTAADQSERKPKYRSTHLVRIYDLDIEFAVIIATHFEIVNIDYFKTF
jgi:tRNA-Thr(GGU) m(6)t(6)A37 methyltransferase TsaA